MAGGSALEHNYCGYLHHRRAWVHHQTRRVVFMERVTRAFLFHEELATQDEGASLEEALEHVLWCVPFFAPTQLVVSIRGAPPVSQGSRRLV